MESQKSEFIINGKVVIIYMGKVDWEIIDEMLTKMEEMVKDHCRKTNRNMEEIVKDHCRKTNRNMEEIVKDHCRKTNRNMEE